MNLRSAHARGDEPGTCGSDSLSRVHAGCKENVLLKGKICFFSMFHEYQMVFSFWCVTKEEQNDLHFQCRVVCTALANFPRNDTFLCLIQLRVH